VTEDKGKLPPKASAKPPKPERPRPIIDPITPTRGHSGPTMRPPSADELRKEIEIEQRKIAQVAKVCPDWRQRPGRYSVTAREAEQRIEELNCQLIEMGEAPEVAEAQCAIGRNIDRLRKECGWSFDALAAQTGIDKKLILSHINKGAKPTLRILKEYAQAFSNGLQRAITVPDLEKEG
jgi:hypothetical protein